LESFSAGTPVIASRLGTMAELVVDGVNGMHFDAGDSEGMRLAVERVVADADLHGRLCLGARDTWEKHYTPEANLVLLQDTYFSLGTGQGS